MQPLFGLLLMFMIASPAAQYEAGAALLPTAYFSKFGDQILSRSICIVRGSVVSVSEAPRSEVVRIEVAKTFKGDQQDTLTLLANPDEFFTGSELLLFLEYFEDGPRYVSFSRISTTDPEYEAKEEFLKQQLRLEAFDNEDDRRNLARRILLENARASASWTQWNMLRELKYVLEEYPSLVRSSDREELGAIAEESTDENFRTELRRLLRLGDE